MHALGFDDVVPPLRRALAFDASPVGPGVELVTLAPLVSPGEALRIHGFEYSIARMLDVMREIDQPVAVILAEVDAV